jgi:hypothetical protein
MRYRDSASYGKRQEYRAIAELLRRGFDVYLTLVDDQGIDCVIRINESRYLDVQIKARSTAAKEKDWGYFPRLFVPSGRTNLFYILYSEGVNAYWVFSSEDIISLEKQPGSNVTKNKNGKNAGRYAIRTCGKNKHGVYAFERFNEFRDDQGFARLR